LREKPYSRFYGKSWIKEALRQLPIARMQLKSAII
jgi:hypothetical protein